MLELSVTGTLNAQRNTTMTVIRCRRIRLSDLTLKELLETYDGPLVSGTLTLTPLKAEPPIVINSETLHAGMLTGKPIDVLRDFAAAICGS